MSWHNNKYWPQTRNSLCKTRLVWCRKKVGKNNLSAGPDNMIAEYLKHAPGEIRELKAQIFN